MLYFCRISLISLNMNPVVQFFSSATNILVCACVIIFFILSTSQAGYTRFELFNFEHPNFRAWQLLSSIFLHGGITHLAFNMIALWSFGQILERVWGSKRFLIFFFACGIGAGLISLGVNHISITTSINEIVASGGEGADIEQLFFQGVASPNLQMVANKDTLTELYYLFSTPMVGASGAIYGLLVAFALMFPNFKVQLIFVPVPVAAKFFVPVLLTIDLVAGFTGFSIFGANIAHFAHLGGALIGLLLVLYWQNQVRNYYQ